MALTDGPAAAALGALFRERWRTAVGEIAEPGAAPAEVWPEGFGVDFTGGVSAVARTEPPWRGNARVREIAALTLEAIASAEKLIYLENQYFTWPLAVEALGARLAEPDGPEVVLICPWKSPSYFDRITMDRARSTALWRLKSSDVFGRFSALAPFTEGGRAIIAHAKLMAIDDRLLKISSANLNNRSHGFDTECELAMEAETPHDQAALATVRDRLAAHWIGKPQAELAELRRLSGSLGQAWLSWALDRRARGYGPWRPATPGLRQGEFIAEFHIGDPTDVADSWRPLRRREQLLTEARAVRRTLAGRQG